MFKTMGYSPGFLLKNRQFSTLANSPEIDPKRRARSQKSFYKGLGGVSESLERFPELAKIRHVQNHGLQPRLFAQKPPIFDTCEFTRNRPKKSRKELEILLQGFLRRFREFGAISRTCQNPPCSKPWAIAQAFCSKTANFRHLRIHPKSTQKVAQGVRNPFTRVQEAFQRVWSDFQNLPKSAMFETMGYSPGFLLKNRQFSTLANSPEIDPKSRARSQKSFYKGLGGVSESLERFPELAKIGHVQNHGLQPRLFAQKPPIFDTCEFTRNRPKKSRKELEILLQGFRRRFREFGAISRTCQNPPCSKPWAIAQAFCSKTANFRHLRIHTTQGFWRRFREFGAKKSRARSQKSFYKGLGGVSESLERFPELAKIRHVRNHGLQPRLFAQKPPIFDTCEFTRNRPKKSRKELEILLQGFLRRFREFGAISRTCQNPPCSKPWAIAQAFCSKTANFRHLRIHPKSTQKVAQGVRNPFTRVQEAFQRVWSDFQNLPKSAMFKTMGYSPGFLLKNRVFAQKPRFREFGAMAMFKTMGNSPGFLLKNRQFSTLVNSPEIDPKRSRKELEIHLQEFSTLANSPEIDPKSPFTRVQEAFQRVCKELEILLQGFRRRFREFGAISRTCQNPPCSKPWAIAQAFCSKTANFRHLRIHPKSTQKVAQGVRNPFTRVQEAFQRVWSDFQNLPKSAMFKTMGYSPGFLLKNRQFSTLVNSPEIDPKSRARSQKSFYKGLGGVSESLERFPELAKIRHVQNHGLQPRLFAQKPPIFDTCEFTRNRPKKTRKELEILLQGFRRRFREFGAISRTCQNPPCSKPWAIAQAFCSKTANFRHLRIHPKSTQKVAQGVRNPFTRVQEAFQRVWSDFQNLPKSAMFKTMGYSPGFLLKNRQFSTLVNSPEIDPKRRARSQKSFYKGF